MNITIFNLALMAGWLLVLIGGCLINVGGGLVVGGVLLIALTLLLARTAGLYAPEKDQG